MKRPLNLGPRYVNPFDAVENWLNSITYSCSQTKLLKDNIKEFGTVPVISSEEVQTPTINPRIQYSTENCTRKRQCLS